MVFQKRCSNAMIIFEFKIAINHYWALRSATTCANTWLSYHDLAPEYHYFSFRFLKVSQNIAYTFNAKTHQLMEKFVGNKDLIHISQKGKITINFLYFCINNVLRSLRFVVRIKRTNIIIICYPSKSRRNLQCYNGKNKNKKKK